MGDKQKSATVSTPPSPSTFASPEAPNSPTSRHGTTPKPPDPSTKHESIPQTNPPLKARPQPLPQAHPQIQAGGFSTPLPPPPKTIPTHNPPPGELIDETARTNALWAEMRATLAEVELAATASTASRSTPQTHFFGPQHAAALEELRNAQIGLAQAWARADGDGRDGGVDESQDGNVSPGGSGKDGDADRSSLAAEKDIATARLRRQANDRYFARVSQGVTDVVGKLDEVATAMGKVEMESRSVWSDDEDSETGSQTAETNDAIAGKKETGSQTTGTNDANTGKNGTGNKDKPKK